MNNDNLSSNNNNNNDINNNTSNNTSTSNKNKVIIMMIKLQNMKPKDTTNITKKIYQKCTFNNVNTLPLKNT